MPSKSTRLPVGTTPTSLAPEPDTDNPRWQSLLVRNPITSTASVFVGGTGVTTSNGFELAPGEALTIDLDPVSPPHAVAVATGVTVHVLQVGV